MRGSFSRWEAEEKGKERRNANASLKELECLRNLSCLEIEIDDCTLSAQEIRLSQNLVKYYIRIGSDDNRYYFNKRDYEKVMILNLPSDIGAVGKWIQKLVRNTELLHLEGDGSGSGSGSGSNNFNIAEIEYLRNLRVVKCSTVKKLDMVFCSLETLILNKLENLEEICLIPNQNVSEIAECFTLQSVEFPKLKSLRLSYLPKLYSLSSLKDVSLGNLKSIYIFNCNKLRSLFSVSVAKTSLLQLEVLDIQHCEAMEEVFWNDGTDDIDVCIEFSKLKRLKLWYLPNLNILFPTKDVSFGNLKSINILLCHKLISLFSVSAGRTSLKASLLQLEWLSVSQCDAMEQVFWNEGTDDNTDGCIEFPKLNKLTLELLPNLTAFCQGLENKSIKFPNLTEMDLGGLPSLEYDVFPLSSEIPCNLKSIKIENFSNLKHLFSVSAARTCLLQLEVLRISSCDAMEQVCWNEGTDDNKDGCIEFPKLNKLTLEHLPNLTAFCLGLENRSIKFPNLTEMDIRGLPSLEYGVFPLSSEIPCNLKSIKIENFSNLKHLFSGSVARTILLQLEVLSISSCDAMEQVFWNEGTDDNTDDYIEFPKLEKLTLKDLPNLTAFWQGLENRSIKFPNLTRMSIGGLPNLNSLSPLNLETFVVHDQNTSLHFFCNPKVEMSCLKNLKLSNFNIRNIWCHQILNNVFNNLEILNINSMNCIKSLMSISIAKNLMSLKYLYINGCGELVEVIERDEDDDKQVVDFNCLFPTLIELNTRRLPKLKKFWQWNHALELPLLESVDISDCPIMETFTLGSINTPNIKMLWVNYNFHEVRVQKDLNDVLRHIWIENQDKSKADGDGDGNKNGNENENSNKD